MVTRDPDVVYRADRIVLPGVGAFADCRRGLDAVDGMLEAMTEAVRVKARPFFGICVGMQLMADARQGACHDRGLQLDRGRRRQDRAARGESEDPAHGLEHARRDPRAPGAGAVAARAEGPARLFRALVPSHAAVEAGRTRRAPITAGRSRRWWPRHYGRYAIPPGEEPAPGAGGDRQFSAVAAGDSSFRRSISSTASACVSPRATWRARPFRQRSRRAGGAFAEQGLSISMSSISTAHLPARR